MEPGTLEFAELDQKTQLLAAAGNSGAGQLPNEQSEMLSELRSKWLDDFEAAALIPPPKPPTFADRLRFGLKVVAEGFQFWFERIRGLATTLGQGDQREGSAAGEQAVQEKPGASEKNTSPRPIVPAGPLAPSVSEEVLELRSGWLADVEANPEKHVPKPVTLATKLRREFEPIADEFSYWFHCLKDFAVRTTTPREERLHKIRGERARRADAAGRFVSAGFVLAVCFGTVVYVATVVHIFDPRHLERILRQ